MIHSASCISKTGVYPGAPVSRAWRKGKDPEPSKHPTSEGEDTSSRAYSGRESVLFLALSFNGFLKTSSGEGGGGRTAKKQQQQNKTNPKANKHCYCFHDSSSKGKSLSSREPPLAHLPQRQFFMGYSEAPKEVPDWAQKTSHAMAGALEPSDGHLQHTSLSTLIQKKANGRGGPAQAEEGTPATWCLLKSRMMWFGQRIGISVSTRQPTNSLSTKAL